MKGDFSRRTFDPRKHYRSVQMQQGRVQLDADWNEQGDIAAHRVETEAQDVVGAHGAPLHEAGFHIVSAVDQLTDEESEEPGNSPDPMPVLAPSGDFFISAGRYYVDGILCENESITTYLGQPDLPDPEPAPGAGPYLVYLDVWQRHITALDNPLLRETALGGPDTATRVKTVWQVKWLATESGDCPGAFQDLRDGLPARDGTLKARAAVPPGDSDLCSLAPSGGYRGLENQLYRVEVHHPGRPYVIPAGDTDVHAVIGMSGSPVDTITPQDGTWSVDDWVEVFGTTSPGGAAEVDPMVGYLARVVGVKGTTLTLDRALPDLMNQTPKVRQLGKLNSTRLYATFKWSRDNGTVVTEITKIAALGASENTEITVHDLGPDEVLGFAAGQWVEISDDQVELSGQRGQLAQIVSVNPKPVDPVVTVKGKINPLAAGDTGVDSARHPKLRRWDGIGLVKYLDSGSPESASKNWQHLEDGVQVQFSAGGYVTGDYWQIPARAITAETESGHVEWPGGKDDPEALPPTGIEHHYAPLAILGPDPPRDCRVLFPPLTELATLVYVGGDGQEAMPGDAIPKPLQVGVFRGRWPVAEARVLYSTEDGGTLTPSAGFSSFPAPAGVANGVIVITKADGIASCEWTPKAALDDPGTWKDGPQQAEARLLNGKDAPLDPVVRFTANLSIAGEVAYDPGSCKILDGKTDVQKAVDTLAGLARIYYVSGDGQDVELPDKTLPLPVRVAVASDCGSLQGDDVKVVFSAEDGARVADSPGGLGGATNSMELSVTAQDGTVECYWQLNANGKSAQELTATLATAGGNPIGAPSEVRFTGNLRAPSAGDSCCVVVEPQDARKLAEIILSHLREGGVCICLKPGDYELPGGLNVEWPVSSGTRPSLTITGCGDATRIVAMTNSFLRGLGSVTWRNLAFQLGDDRGFRGEGIGTSFDECQEIMIDSCRLQNGPAQLPGVQCLCGIGRAQRVEVRSSSFALARELPVLALMDAAADVHLEDNLIAGVLCLGGLPDEKLLNDRDLAELRSLPEALSAARFRFVLPPRTRFGRAGERFHARGNRIGAVRIGSDWARAIRDFGPDSPDLQLSGVHSTAFLANNTIEGMSELVVREASLTANALLANTVVVAHSAVYVGNHTRPAELVHLDKQGALLLRGGELGMPSAVSVDPRSGFCWVADLLAHCVMCIDSAGKELWRNDRFQQPLSLGTSPRDGSCWVADGLARQVTRLAADGSVLVAVGHLEGPCAVAVNPADGSCWVADPPTKQVIHVAADGSLVAAIRDLGNPFAISVSPEDGSCWVADQAARRVIRYSARGTPLWERRGFNLPGSICANPRDASCWVADAGASQVIHLGADGQDLLPPVDLPRPTSVSADPNDGSCWVGCGSTFPVPVSVNLEDSSCWVADAGSGEVAHVSMDGQILWQGTSTGVTVFSSTHAEEQCANLRVVIKPT